jgi:uncharacterized SAM-dependent methyltransferase
MKINDHARAILAFLGAEGIGDRSIVFVCHSLGGLVTKAMLQIAGSDETYLTILENTKGVIFFGTPHLGAEVASIFKIFPLSSTISKQIHKNSDYLCLLNNIFQRIAKEHEIEILSFVEKALFYGIIIVDADSAKCVEWEKVVPLPENHTNICKPKDKSSIQYRTLLKFISDLIGPTPLIRKGVRGVILSTESVGSSIENINYSIISGQPIPSKYFYEFDWCAENWCEFFDERYIEEIYGLKKFLCQINFPKEILHNNTEITYISLGVGDGRKDKEVINHLWKTMKCPIEYRPLDVSLPLLKRTCKKALSLSRNKIGVTAQYLCGELSDIARCADDLGGKARLFSILGNTIGNLMSDGHTLNVVSSVMKSGDLLLLDVRSLTSFDEFKENDGNHAKASRFSFSPLQTLGWTFDIDKFNVQECNIFSNIESGRTAIVVYHDDKKNKIVQLDHINFYNDSSMELFFKKIGLYIVEKLITNNSFYFLFKKY